MVYWLRAATKRGRCTLERRAFGQRRHMLCCGTGRPTTVARLTHTAVEALKKQGEAQYIDGILDAPEQGELDGTKGEGGVSGESDPLYDQAVQIVLQNRRALVLA